jgi:hypothetical protein
VYVWTERMPLSVFGAREATLAAEALDLPLTILHRNEVTAGLERVLGPAGALDHFPSLILMEQDSVVGLPIVGFLRSQEYEEHLGLSAASSSSEVVVSTPAEQGPPLQTIWRRQLRSRIGFFYRYVPRSTLIAFDSAAAVYLLDLTSGSQSRAPGELDFVPSPDGNFFVTPGVGDPGLRFFDRIQVMGYQAQEGEELPAPAFVDRHLTDQYPSVGLLDASEHGPRRYRVVVSWFDEAAYRDYEVSRDGNNDLIVVPLGPAVRPCPGKGLATPILSPSGGLLAGRDRVTGRTLVLGIGSETCEVVAEVGGHTSKVGFSADETKIAYSRRVPGRPFYEVEVFDLGSGSVRPVPGSRSTSPAIPEFVGAGALLFLVTRNGHPDQLTAACCVPATSGGHYDAALDVPEDRSQAMSPSGLLGRDGVGPEAFPMGLVR